MSELSVEKLNAFKRKKCLTNKKIAELTGISIVTVDTIFSGKNKNPTVNHLQKIAKVLDCAMDDLIEYDKDSALSDYYENKETSKIAQELHDNPDFRTLFDATKNLKPEDIQMIIDIAHRIKGNYHNGK